jgi:ubiquinone/menaquinone biosynthesis C-methylase UbiE
MVKFSDSPRVEFARTMEHYKQVAREYNNQYIDAGCATALMKAIIKAVPIGDNDVGVDVGTGTGVYLGLVTKELAAADKWYGLDPSPEMLSQAQVAESRLVCATAESYAAGAVVGIPEKVDVVTVKGTIQHIHDPRKFLVDIAQLLKPGGRIAVISQPPETEQPLFSLAKEAFKRDQMCPERVKDAIENAELSYQVTRFCYRRTMELATAIRRVRGRYMTLMENFSDVELEAGIAEMTGKYPPVIIYHELMDIHVGTTRRG